MDNQQDLESLGKKARPRGIYLLPNLFTTASLFAAFYAIISAVNGHFDVACMAIFFAMLADTLDGRVARMTNTQTAFGAEYDSLADMVSFGIAPALIVYSWALSHLGKLGWLAAFTYTAATALRLARFNTQAHDQDKRYFQGLSCTAAAGVVSGMVWLGDTYMLADFRAIWVFAALLTVFLAMLMVSTIRFHSFKQIDFKGKVPFFVVLIPIVVLVAIALEPAEMLFAIFFIYALSGPIMTLWQLRRMRRNGKKKVK